MNSKNVLVLGSGVCGLTTALKLLRNGHKVTIWSREADGELPRTSLNAYAMWVPVKIDADARIEHWTNESFPEFESLSHDPATGVVMRQIFVLKQAREEPWYAGKLAVFRHARPEELSSGYADAHVLDMAPVIDPSTYLPWLRKQVLAAGGSLLCKEATQFSDCPSDYPVIINCTGLGARRLVSDKGLVPERVQVVKLKANGLDRVVIDDEGPNKRSCIVPHAGYIRVGAVFDGNQESLDVDDSLTTDILARCSRIVPGFKLELADVVSVTRAHRPERALPRVEVEELPAGRTVVHNYGHDGMGYILSYGIAAEIAGYVAAR